MKNNFVYTKLDIPRNEYELLNLIIKRDVYFLYHSLNHIKLKQVIDNVVESGDMNHPFYRLQHLRDIPLGLKFFTINFPELYQEFKIERVGKLRKITFDPNGRVNIISIGNKRARSFRLEVFGHSVFSIKTNYYEINYSIK